MNGLAGSSICDKISRTNKNRTHPHAGHDIYVYILRHMFILRGIYVTRSVMEYIYIHITKPNVPESAMVEYYAADLS